jgi:hypothetical protein
MRSGTDISLIARGSVFNAPVADVALQTIVQGVLTAIVALLLYGRMVSILGATVQERPLWH